MANVAWEIGVDNRGIEEGRNNAAQTTAKRHAAHEKERKGGGGGGCIACSIMVRPYRKESMTNKFRRRGMKSR